MTEELLEQLRFKQYAELVSSICGIECELSLVESDPDFVSQALLKKLTGSSRVFLSSLLQQACWVPVLNNVERYDGPVAFLLLRTYLELGAEEKGYWMTIQFPRPVIDDIEENLEVIAQMLSHLSRLISDDHTQNLMLDGMARELAIRYEELNVIYGLDDLSAGDTNDNPGEKQALSRLIENCLDYLPVDLAAVIIPADGLLISNMDKASDDLSAKPILDFFTSIILDRIKTTGETLVINQDKTTDWTEFEVELPIKFIASPIFSLNKEITGIFVFTNFLNKPDFTNSDRKLCDVFAVEVSNLVKGKRDALTGLLSRRGLENKLAEIISTDKDDELCNCIVHLDVDQFTVINDTSGFSTGDKLLQHVASVLKSLFDDATVLARIGTDEFVVLLENISEVDATDSASRIQETLKEIHYFSGDRSYEIKLSIGIAKICAEDQEPSETLQAAELACQAAKNQGGDRIRVYNPSDADLMQYQNIANNASQIKDALLLDRFVLYAQAIVPAKDVNNNSAHYEVLVRMLDEDNKPIPPGVFIPAAERYMMMSELDKSVIDKSIEVLTEYNRMTGTHSMTFSINISGQSIVDDRFRNYVLDTVSNSEVWPEQLCFEVTETAAISNLSDALKFIKHVRGLGCRFALDDFGAGMSSFNYLKHLPIDYLKIDGHFVKNILEHSIDATMVKAMHNIGHVMGLQTIAEFVENREIQQALIEIGVDYLQGYGLHKPQPIVDALSLQAGKLSLAKVAG